MDGQKALIDYAAYLQSDQWAEKRRAALERAGNRCQVCNGETRLDVHHRTYVRLGFERPEDLTVLCDGCQKLFHEQRTLDPYKAFSRRQTASCCFCGTETDKWQVTDDGRAQCAPPCSAMTNDESKAEAA